MDIDERIKHLDRVICGELDRLAQKGHAVYPYYCLCGQIVLLIDETLDNLSVRKTDGCTIIDNERHLFKLVSKPGPMTVIKRQHGDADAYERQYRHLCTRCSLPIGYEFTPVKKDGPFTFIFENALVPKQGVFPTKFKTYE